MCEFAHEFAHSGSGFIVAVSATAATPMVVVVVVVVLWHGA